MEKEKWQTKFLRLCYEQGVTLKEIIDNGFPNKDSTIKYLSGDNPLMMRWDIINTYVKNLENKDVYDFIKNTDLEDLPLFKKLDSEDFFLLKQGDAFSSKIIKPHNIDEDSFFNLCCDGFFCPNISIKFDTSKTFIVEYYKNKELVKIKDNNSHYWYMENGTLKDWRYKDNILNETEDEENEI